MESSMENKKTVLITGAAMGIGKETAMLFLANGYKVIGLDKEQINYVDNNLFTFVVNIKDASSLEEISKKIGKIDILVCNAGYQTVGNFDNTTYEQFKDVVEVNLVGTFNTIKAFKKNLVKGGKIINISSVHGEKPRTEKFAYDASKAGINMLTKELALEFEKDRICVNSIAIGATETPMNDELLKNKKMLKEAEDKIVLGRLAKAKEVAEVIFEVASSKFDYLNGSVITFDGGRNLK